MIRLRCLSCAAQEEAATGHTSYRCVQCGGILEALVTSRAWEQLDTRHVDSLWRYRSRLPVGPDVRPVSLGEGLTPLHRCEALDDLVPGSVRVWVKDETGNPSGSFKDRLVSVGVTRACEGGSKIVTCASSGNAAAATAAYAARAGLTALVFVPEHTPLAKVRQARAYGARVVLVPGDYSSSYRICDEVARRFEWPNLTTTYLNPYGTAGLATVGYELAEQLTAAGVTTPDLVAAPVGSGPLVYGVDRGWTEAREHGKAAGRPALLAVQSSGCAPIARAFAAGDDEVEPWDTPTSVASGINDPLRGYAEDGTATLGVVRSSGGAAVAVDDEHIAWSAQQLARRVGVLAEPTGAAALAGVVAHARAQPLPRGANVVVLVTGHAYKEPDHMPQTEEEPVRLPAGLAPGGGGSAGGRIDLDQQLEALGLQLDVLGADVATESRGG